MVMTDYVAIARRDDELADDREGGATFRELAEKYGISRQRCHQIYSVVMRGRERSGDALFVKVRAAAARVGTPHVGRAYNAIRKYALEGDGVTWDDIVSCRNVGKVTAVVIAMVLGVEVPEDVLDMLRLRGYLREGSQK